MPHWKLQLLDPPLLERNGIPVDVGRRKAVALLAYLATTGQSHSRDSLAALFWPEYDHSTARTDLRRTLSVLNKTLGPRRAGDQPENSPLGRSGQPCSKFRANPLVRCG